jgi:DNA uptake protein ComE-like DNA-binding protein
MFPTVEPDLLHILNHGTVKQLKGLKECGQSRAELIISSRPPAGFASVLDLMHKDILSCKILNRLVYANSMEADSLAALAHSVVVHKET